MTPHANTVSAEAVQSATVTESPFSRSHFLEESGAPQPVDGVVDGASLRVLVEDGPRWPIAILGDADRLFVRN
ncbi:hypothetical protein [Rubrivirga sp.]|uniref:hypothetical protein n=1 Tax=Rubrivirga sp. TaxID=1885344 RepID=UPI003C732CF8